MDPIEWGADPTEEDLALIDLTEANYYVEKYKKESEINLEDVDISNQDLPDIEIIEEIIRDAEKEVKNSTEESPDVIPQSFDIPASPACTEDPPSPLLATKRAIEKRNAMKDEDYLPPSPVDSIQNSPGKSLSPVPRLFNKKILKKYINFEAECSSKSSGVEEDSDDWERTSLRHFVVRDSEVEESGESESWDTASDLEFKAMEKARKRQSAKKARVARRGNGRGSRASSGGKGGGRGVKDSTQKGKGKGNCEVVCGGRRGGKKKMTEEQLVQIDKIISQVVEESVKQVELDEISKGKIQEVEVDVAPGVSAPKGKVVAV